MNVKTARSYSLIVKNLLLEVNRLLYEMSFYYPIEELVEKGFKDDRERFDDVKLGLQNMAEEIDNLITLSETLTIDLWED